MHSLCKSTREAAEQLRPDLSSFPQSDLGISDATQLFERAAILERNRSS